MACVGEISDTNRKNCCTRTGSGSEFHRYVVFIGDFDAEAGLTGQVTVLIWTRHCAHKFMLTETRILKGITLVYLKTQRIVDFGHRGLTAIDGLTSKGWYNGFRKKIYCGLGLFYPILCTNFVCGRHLYW